MLVRVNFLFLIFPGYLMGALGGDACSERPAELGVSGVAQEWEYYLIVPIPKLSPVHQAWEHRSPVRGPSYRHTDSLPTDLTLAAGSARR